MRTQVMVDGQGKAPESSGETSHPASNGVNFGGLSVTVVRLRTHNLASGSLRRGFGRAHYCRFNAGVPLELSRTGLACAPTARKLHIRESFLAPAVWLASRHIEAIP